MDAAQSTHTYKRLVLTERLLCAGHHSKCFTGRLHNRLILVTTES